MPDDDPNEAYEMVPDHANAAEDRSVNQRKVTSLAVRPIGFNLEPRVDTMI
jgi:hypothetical protein